MNLSYRMKQPKPPEEYNPYSARQARLIDLELDRIQSEADSFSNAPTNIVRTVWDRFVEFRRKRTELERQVRNSPSDQKQ